MSSTSALAGSAIHTLDGVQLADALRAGIYRLFQKTDHINKINVFPVPDGDTGTNMSMTLAAVLAAVERSPQDHAGRLLVGAADAALDGARGNSGAILAQFLLGLGDRAGHLAQVGARDFALAAGAGATYARDALTQPREGTLLTVLADFAQELERLTRDAQQIDFRVLFARAMEPVRRSLAGTRDVLEEMRAANVVDAGAQGFVELLEGITHYLDTGEVGVVASPVHAGDEAMVASGPGDTQHRYCTECMITGEGLEPRRVRESLGAFGSSLVVGGTKAKLRIHIHTNEPENLFRFVAQYGVVSAQKADDMLQQQAAAHHSKNRHVAIVTDSAADIPEELMESLQVHLVPVRVHFGSRSYLDKVSLSPAEFYRELETNPEHPKTSQPPPGDFRRLYEFLVSHYEAVISISLSARISGTYNAAVTAAQRVAGNRVRIIDSSNVSLGQGLLAIHAAERALAGDTADQVEAAVQRARPRIKTYALLARVDYAVRGGRIPPLVKTLATWLRFSPVLHTTPDGRVVLCGVIWGRHRLRERFARFIAQRTDPAESHRLLIGHGNTEDEARRLCDDLKAVIAKVESSYVIPLGTALGVHGGPGMLVVGIERRSDAG